ncbi:histamine H2 receptor isoform X2 [Latimeria chalumnae]|nr:PREDICTED: histamine H2 receptor-like isoform X1 [Latimeria chalumnae]XP_006012419.1 PREDICTED: histamine H2 receptor-like isoform X1 [Latimeria chalumnae]XP_014354018.1 PREDICTED: histamine H2 receptor-like isoform X1 [Latimeria chalumnae]|eukprot:XP_006012418.1 PREDICTED: histamine H2 receptor-like isoform X1 [Latimeria chalumnae]
MHLEKNTSLFPNCSVALFLSNRKENNTMAEIAPQQAAVGVLLTLLDLVTFLGNTVVFICPVVEKRLRTVTYMFIMSLAMADLLVACLVMPFSIIYEVTGMWMFGQQFCKVWISFDVMFCTASIVTLCFISLDRYCSVVTPYHYPRRMSRRRDFQRALKKLICRRWRSQVDIGEDMVSIVTFSKTAQDPEHSVKVTNLPQSHFKSKQ